MASIGAHPSTAVAGAAAVALVIAIFLARRPQRAWLPPLSMAMGVFIVAIATFSAMRHIVRGFGTTALAGSEGLGPAAALILESRYQGLVAALVLLALAAVGFASTASRDPEPPGPGLPTAPAARGVSLLLFLLSSSAVLATILLMFWEMSQASWLVRTLADGPLDLKLLTRTAPSDVHGRLGLSLAGLGFLCIASIGGGIVLAILSFATASKATPPRWFVYGNRVLLAILVLVALVALVRGSAQRSWLRGIAAAGQVPGIPRLASSIAAFPPCRPRSSAQDVAELSSQFTEPIEVSRVKPVYPEAARVARMQGVVVLEAVIAPDGKVRSVCVLRSLNPLLDAAAGRAVMQWSYEPATRKSNGEAVAVYLTVTVTFTLT